jgi:hypothetical protein
MVSEQATKLGKKNGRKETHRVKSCKMQEKHHKKVSTLFLRVACAKELFVNKNDNKTCQGNCLF